MTLHYTIPEGPLVSFGGFIFKPRRSLRLPGDELSMPGSFVPQLGNIGKVDQAGYATVSASSVYVWQYDVFCAPGDSVTSVQDEITALVTACATKNSDGTTGQVALLTVKLLGYATATATALARLTHIATTESYSTRKRLSLTFETAGLFTYTT